MYSILRILFSQITWNSCIQSNSYRGMKLGGIQKKMGLQGEKIKINSRKIQMAKSTGCLKQLPSIVECCWHWYWTYMICFFDIKTNQFCHNFCLPHTAPFLLISCLALRLRIHWHSDKISYRAREENWFYSCVFFSLLYRTHSVLRIPQITQNQSQNLPSEWVDKLHLVGTWRTALNCFHLKSCSLGKLLLHPAYCRGKLRYIVFFRTVKVEYQHIPFKTNLT